MGFRTRGAQIFFLRAIIHYLCAGIQFFQSAYSSALNNVRIKKFNNCCLHYLILLGTNLHFCLPTQH